MKFAGRVARLGTETAFTVLGEVQELRARGRDIVSLGIGDPDFETPLHIRDAAKQALDAGRTHYSDPAGTAALRLAAAEHLTATRGVTYSPDEVIVTPGAKPILFHALLAAVEEGDEVLCPNPGFPIYESVARFAGARPVPLPLLEEREFRLDLDELRKSAGPRTRMIILNSPNNPTGGVLSTEDLEVVAEVARERDAWVISDEIYSRFLYEGRHISIAQLPGMKERSIVLDGFSKTYAMTGWRLGYAGMPLEMARRIEMLNVNSFSCTATFLQDAAVTALTGSQVPVDSMIAEFRARRDLAIPLLEDIDGVQCRVPAGAFYAFPNVTGACRRLGLTSAEEFQKLLLHEGGVAVLSRSCFGDRNENETAEYVRISFATSRELLIEGIARIRAIVDRSSSRNGAGFRDSLD